MSENTTQSSPPIEATCSYTDDVACSAVAAVMQLARPKMIRVYVVIFLGLEGHALAYKRDVYFQVGIAAIVGALYLLNRWEFRTRFVRGQATLLGEMVTTRFFETGFELGQGDSRMQIPYSEVTNAGRSDQGLVIGVKRRGSVFVPTRAFASTSERDAAFSHLGRVLKGKRSPSNESRRTAAPERHSRPQASAESVSRRYTNPAASKFRATTVMLAAYVFSPVLAMLGYVITRIVDQRREGKRGSEVRADGEKLMTGSVWLDASLFFIIMAAICASVFLIFLWV